MRNIAKLWFFFSNRVSFKKSKPSPGISSMIERRPPKCANWKGAVANQYLTCPTGWLLHSFMISLVPLIYQSIGLFKSNSRQAMAHKDCATCLLFCVVNSSHRKSSGFFEYIFNQPVDMPYHAMLLSKSSLILCRNFQCISPAKEVKRYS